MCVTQCTTEGSEDRPSNSLAGGSVVTWRQTTLMYPGLKLKPLWKQCQCKHRKHCWTCNSKNTWGTLRGAIKEKEPGKTFAYSSKKYTVKV